MKRNTFAYASYPSSNLSTEPRSVSMVIQNIPIEQPNTRTFKQVQIISWLNERWRISQTRLTWEKNHSIYVEKNLNSKVSFVWIYLNHPEARKRSGGYPYQAEVQIRENGSRKYRVWRGSDLQQRSLGRKDLSHWTGTYWRWLQTCPLTKNYRLV